MGSLPFQYKTCGHLLVRYNDNSNIKKLLLNMGKKATRLKLFKVTKSNLIDNLKHALTKVLRRLPVIYFGNYIAHNLDLSSTLSYDIKIYLF